jgi:hypothetical protein
MTKDEALRLAWDALQQIAHVSAMDYEYQQWAVEAITAIKAALKAKDGECKYCTDGCPACDARKLPEQEPVTIPDCGEAGHADGACGNRECLPSFRRNTTPPQRTWIGLTDKEIEEIWKIAMFTDYGIGAELSNQPFVHYARAIEAKLKEKNNG